MTEQTNTTGTEAGNTTLVRRFVEAAQTGDRATMADCMVEDYIQVFPRPGAPGLPTRTTSRAAILEFVDRAATYRPGSKRAVIESCTAEGDTVALQVRMSAVTASGEAYENFYAHFYTCREGRIVQAWEYADTLYGAARLFPDSLGKPPIPPGSHPDFPPAPEPDPVAEPRKHTALRFMRAAQSGDCETVSDCTTEDLTLVFPRPGMEGAPQSAEGRDTVLGFLRDKLPYQPGSLVMKVERIAAQADMVAVQFRMNAVTRQGEPYENFYAQFHQFRGDRITKSWEYCDTLYGAQMLKPDAR